MNDLDLYRARTTRHITLVLVYGFLILILALLVAAFAPWQSSDKFVSIANPLLTGLLSLASGAVGFWTGHKMAAGDSPVSVTTTTTPPAGSASPATETKITPLVPTPTQEKTP